MQIGFIFSLIFAIFIAVFALQNSASVDVNILFTKVNMSQALIILISACFGAIIVAIFGFIRQFKMTMKIRGLKKEINDFSVIKQEHEKQIEELKKQLEFKNEPELIEQEERNISDDSMKQNMEIVDILQKKDDDNKN